MPRKKSNQKPKANKSAFVRDLPATIPAAEVVQKAKAAGIKLTLKHVYVIRSKAKVANGKGGRPRPGWPPKAIAAPVAPMGLDSAFTNLVLDIGFARADAILTRLRRTARAAVLG